MYLTRYARAGLGLAMLAVACGCSAPTRLSPEAARAKGDDMLKQMSRTVAGTQTFSFRAEQTVDRIRGGGERVTDRFSRTTNVRRPMVAFVDQGSERDAAAWYDGKQLTIMSNKEKVWARGPMPGTLDEAIDFLAAEYAVRMPSADLLYSNPYDALITPDTTGGWVDVEKVGDRSCEHLSYQQPAVDWQIWLAQDDRRLPCQIQITYKAEPGQPVAKVVFHDWNAAPTLSDATFTPAIPEGYRRIRIMRHATVQQPAGGEEGKQQP